MLVDIFFKGHNIAMFDLAYCHVKVFSGFDVAQLEYV